MPDISVIIPNLHSTFIDQTLQALHQQTVNLANVEVLVVGLDGPNLVGENNLVRLIDTGKPATPAQARNIGIQQAQGGILCFTDADCLPAPTWLERISQQFAADDVMVIGGSTTFPSDNYWTICDNLSWFHECTTFSPPGQRDQLPSLNLAVRRSVIEMVGLFNESYPRAAGEDAEWTVRMRQKGYKLIFTPEVQVTHYPARATLKSIWQHGYTYGRYSVKINPRHQSFLKTSPILQSALKVIGLTPVLALWATGRIFWQYRSAWRYWWAIPGIYLGKVAWCLGAATTLWKQQKGNPTFATLPD